MNLTLEEKFENLLNIINLPESEFEESGNLVQDLRAIHDIVTSATQHATKPLIQEVLFELYKFCFEFKVETGTSIAECIWAMTNQIKDLNKEMEEIQLCSEAHDHAEEHARYLLLKQKEVLAILDVIMVATMRHSDEC